MKKLMTLALTMTIAIAANAMDFRTARNEALFLTDKMAYELNLSTAQMDAVYEINLDYLMSVGTSADIRGTWWARRNADLRMVLSPRQYAAYAALAHFYTPLSWSRGQWVMSVRNVYTTSRFYRPRPSVFDSYRGGNNRRPDHYAAHRPAEPRHQASTWRQTNRPTPPPANNGRSHRR
ncbi:MAG: hypothetical protein IJT98_10205 [Prevotella sp.]|nr:hypothetical protein [Prevotella sp.]